MGTRRRRAGTTIGLAALAAAALAAGTGPDGDDGNDAGPLRLRASRDAATDTVVRAGTFRVAEDRAAGAGRMLDLKVVVLPATGDDPAPDPVFVIDGGPGVSAADLHRRHLDSWMRERRDIVLVSQRGTGGTNRLDCAAPGDDEHLQAYLEPIFDPPRFRACLDELSARADLRHYSTPTAMDDLDDVRAALGYERINLYGGSYGTRAALVYLRRHAETVRSAILNGVAPLSFTNPLYHAREAQWAIDRIFAECAADPACAAAYGDLPARLAAVLARLEAEPAEVAIVHPATGAPVTVRLGRDAFAGALRVLMYRDSREIPYLVDRAAAGDLAVFAQRGIETNRALRDMIAFGMLLCVTCSEDIPRIDPAAIGPATEGTFLGDIRVRQQMAVCATWPRSDLPAGFGEPVRSDVPVLLLSGSLDPVTPPRWGEAAVRHLARGRHVVVPGSHGVSGPCVESLMRAFLDAGTADGLDTSCAEAMRLPPFRRPD
ncbi:MAG: alpha/beta hydrolase [Planctomycetota bacterium]|jgi:pimeloyl-ACP methyl ester carboxylesterase